MKLFKLIPALLLALTLGAGAGDLSYTSPIQANESSLTVVNKQAVALVNGGSFRNITTNTTTVVKSASGVLERIVVNTAGSSATVTIYDNTAASGTKIGTASANAQGLLTYNAHFATGLTIVTTGAPDITVVYR